jgi:hypothetical protein
LALFAIVVGIPALVVITTLLGLSSWSEHRFRVRMRTLLAAMTLVAIVLGFIVWASR